MHFKDLSRQGDPDRLPGVPHLQVAFVGWVVVGLVGSGLVVWVGLDGFVGSVGLAGLGCLGLVWVGWARLAGAICLIRLTPDDVMKREARLFAEPTNNKRLSKKSSAPGSGAVSLLGNASSSGSGTASALGNASSGPGAASASGNEIISLVSPSPPRAHEAEQQEQTLMEGSQSLGAAAGELGAWPDEILGEPSEPAPPAVAEQEQPKEQQQEQQETQEQEQPKEQPQGQQEEQTTAIAATQEQEQPKEANQPVEEPKEQATTIAAGQSVEDLVCLLVGVGCVGWLSQ